MQIIDGPRQVTCAELLPSQMRAMTSPLATRILRLLAARPNGMYPAAIAKELREEQQKIYYHCRRMVKERILIVDHVEDARGGIARSLALRAGAFAVRCSEYTPAARTLLVRPDHAAFLAPFVHDGELHATIVVGSPDPHGPQGARSRDVHYAVDLGLFLGSFLTTPAPQSVVLDTELREWNRNLIVVGGVVVNKAAERINTRSPIFYDTHARTFRGADGTVFDGETDGIIVKMPNPFARGKWILHIAGKHAAGTRAAMLALLTHFDDICGEAPKGRIVPRSVIVRGIDADSDGIVDTVRILNKA
ncbi:TPA: hypothetical protein HA251_03415 [Candidatus Woesearchaeota archaeon]|nr:hypothetical protein [Candidatus Woesearchaeota archaeon]